MNTFKFLIRPSREEKQSVYFKFDGNYYFLMNVYPNVNKHFFISHISDAFFDEEQQKYFDVDGDPVQVYTDLDYYLTDLLMYDVGKALYAVINFVYYNIDHIDMTYIDLAKWALNRQF